MATTSTSCPVSPWSPCNATCGSGVRSRSKCNEEEYQVCFVEECPPALECDLSEIEILPALMKTRIDVNINLRRHKGLENAILSQSIQFANRHEPSNGVRKTWVMNKENRTMEEANYFKEQIPSSCGGDDDNCKPDADSCRYCFQNLKMKTVYRVTLFITQKSMKEYQGEANQVFEVLQCQQPDLVLDVWPCGNNQSILATQVCDSKVDCENARDESEGVCRGEQNILYSSLAVIGLSCLSFIIAIVVFLRCFSNGCTEENFEEGLEDEKIVDFLEKTNDDYEDKKSMEMFSKLSQQSRIIILNIFSIVDIQKLKNTWAMNKKLSKGKAEKILIANREPKQLMKTLRNFEEPSKIPIPNICQNNQNFYGKCEKTKGFLMAICQFIMSTYQLSVFLSLLTVIFHFNSEIIQFSYQAIQNLDLNEMFIFLSVLAVINFVVNVYFDIKNLQKKFSGMKKMLAFVPLFSEAYMTIEKIWMIQRKFKISKEISSCCSNDETIPWMKVLNLMT